MLLDATLIYHQTWFRLNSMRLGLVADLHGDIRALETTLRRLEELAVDQVICLGDLIGYGSEPDAVVTAIRDRAVSCIRGNHDRWALEKRQMIGLRGWKIAALRDDTWDFLQALPGSLRLEVDGEAIEFHHGSPTGDTEAVTAYKPLPPSVEEFWSRSDARVLVLGHTHSPMIERGPRGTVINPGSVLGVTGIHTSYTFAVLDASNLSVRIHEVRTGREIRRD
ncbi:MAG: metallophosphoesterase family protein, partial [Isosphaeraceae bacterium]